MADLPALPKDFSYSAEHEWVNQGPDTIAGQTVKIGITAVAADALGEVVYLDLPSVGDGVKAGETCGEVESTKSVSDLYSPLTGTVTAVNDALDTTPELVNSDPYGDGWMYEMSLSDASQVDGLLDVEAYTAQLS